MYGLCPSDDDGVTLECGIITIKNAADDFLSRLKYEGGSDKKGWKIGKGYTRVPVTFSGGTFNGSSFTDGYGEW